MQVLHNRAKLGRNDAESDLGIPFDDPIHVRRRGFVDDVVGSSIHQDEPFVLEIQYKWKIRKEPQDRSSCGSIQYLKRRGYKRKEEVIREEKRRGYKRREEKRLHEKRLYEKRLTYIKRNSHHVHFAISRE